MKSLVLNQVRTLGAHELTIHVWLADKSKAVDVIEAVSSIGRLEAVSLENTFEKLADVKKELDFIVNEWTDPECASNLQGEIDSLQEDKEDLEEEIVKLKEQLEETCTQRTQNGS